MFPASLLFDTHNQKKLSILI